MKKLLSLLIAGVCFHSAVLAQCDKNYKITASLTQYVDSSGNIEREKQENSSIQVTGQDILITPGNEEDVMKGKIKIISCNWKVPYKEGKTVIRTELEDKRADVKAATITFEGKDGKLTVLVVADEFPNRRIRLNMDSFVEK